MADKGPNDPEGNPFERAQAAELRDTDVALEATEVNLVTTSTDVGDSKYSQRLEEARIETLKIENDLLKEELGRVQQQRSYRKLFFWWALIAISAVLLASGVVFFWYMGATGGRPSDAAIAAWLSSTIVETLGFGYVIANYLFEPRRGRGGSRGNG